MPNPPKKVIDTRSGRVFPALNQCYLVLLREGELEEMRRAGKLKDNPEEDTFGYYRMRRFYPGRFVQEDDTLRWPRSRHLRHKTYQMDLTEAPPTPSEKPA